MRRSNLVLVTLALWVLASACSSTTAPVQRGEWMPDGTWCSGYINPTGQCVEVGGGD
jgi:hypothetical protein